LESSLTCNQNCRSGLTACGECVPGYSRVDSVGYTCEAVEPSAQPSPLPSSQPTPPPTARPTPSPSPSPPAVSDTKPRNALGIAFFAAWTLEIAAVTWIAGTYFKAPEDNE